LRVSWAISPVPRMNPGLRRRGKLLGHHLGDDGRDRHVTVLDPGLLPDPMGTVEGLLDEAG